MQQPSFDPARVIDSGDLTPVVRQILNDGRAEVVAPWSVVRIGKSAGTGTVGIWRVSGTAASKGGSRSWSAVLKALDLKYTRTIAGFETPQTELAAYRSGLFDERAGAPPLKAARCYSADDRPGGLTLLWLEDFAASPRPPWPDDTYVTVARHVGQFNGAWSARTRELPDWIKKGAYWHWISDADIRKEFETLPGLLGHQLIRDSFPEGTVEKSVALGETLFRLYTALDGLPFTVCHADCHPKNLFPVLQQGRHIATAGVDWASVSLGPVGIDAGPLLGSPAGWIEMDVEQFRRLVEPVFDSYLAGLKRSGWTGDPSQARLGYFASLLDYGGRSVWFTTRFVSKPGWTGWLTGTLGHSAEDLAGHWRNLREVIFPLADEALELSRAI